MWTLVNPVLQRPSRIPEPTSTCLPEIKAQSMCLYPFWMAPATMSLTLRRSVSLDCHVPNPIAGCCARWPRARIGNTTEGGSTLDHALADGASLAIVVDVAVDRVTLGTTDDIKAITLSMVAANGRKVTTGMTAIAGAVGATWTMVVVIGT